jgi:hypothetical protein
VAIKITRDEVKDLTIHVVIGPVSEEEMYDAIENFYNREPTMFLLWDMSQAEVADVASSVLEAFVQRAATLEGKRKGGRTAVFAPYDLQFGIGRMSEAFAELKSMPFKFRVFRSRQCALEWLISDYSS